MSSANRRRMGVATPAAARSRGGHGPERVLLLGAGSRGRVYTDWILRHPGRLQVCGVAEPDPVRRAYIRDAHGLPAETCFANWSEALDAVGAAGANAFPGGRPDAVIVATQDRMHTEPAVGALEMGLHVLLEKPMAASRIDIEAIAEAAEHAAGTLTVCHVLRYSSFFTAVKRIIDDGQLGDIQSIFHAENVSYYHFAHSYVRGNWRDRETSSPLILAKSCHDLDILCWLADSPPEWVASTAELGFFKPESAPEGGPARCSDGCPVGEECPYNAERIYLEGLPLKMAAARERGPLAAAARFSVRHPGLAARLPFLSQFAVWKHWPTDVITTDLTAAGIRAALADGPYGRCVFRCDNNQPDHQETIIRFANGITASFRLHGRSSEEGRTIRIDGSRGTLKGKFGSGTVLELFPHGSLHPVRIPVKESILGHSAADDALMEAWAGMLTQAASPGEGGPRGLSTDARTSLVSHRLAFAADEAARTGEAVQLSEGEVK